MAKVQEERVEVGAMRSDYQFGFHDPDHSVFRARKGLDHEIVAQLSEIKGEPSWMRDIRLKALDIFLQKPLPRWGGYLDDLNFDDIYYYANRFLTSPDPGGSIDDAGNPILTRTDILLELCADRVAEVVNAGHLDSFPNDLGTLDLTQLLARAGRADLA